jgi:murein DD-endopeptidase MepM/ murein hydrolase activator NlpD
LSDTEGNYMPISRRNLRRSHGDPRFCILAFEALESRALLSTTTASPLDLVQVAPTPFVQSEAGQALVAREAIQPRGSSDLFDVEEMPNLRLIDAFLVDINGKRMEPATVGTVGFVEVEVDEQSLTAGTTYQIVASINGEPQSETFAVGDGNPRRIGYWVIRSGPHTLEVTLDPDDEIPDENPSDNSLPAPKLFTPETFGSLFALPLGPPPAPQSEWFILFYVDLDPTGGIADYYDVEEAEEEATYDGHDGLDFLINNYSVMDAGVPILAIADGIVLATTDGTFDRNLNPEGPSNGVTLDHGNRWISQYGHMRFGSIAVRPGDTVKQGQLLGYVGSSAADNPHLHFAVKRRYTDSDPAVDPNKAWNEATTVETYVDPHDYWSAPIPFRNEIRTVNGIGVSDELPWDYLFQHGERPPDRRVFLPGETVYFWNYSWRISGAPGLEVRWLRNGQPYNDPDFLSADHNTLVAPAPLPGQTDSWDVEIRVGGELVSNAVVTFDVTTDPDDGPPEIKVYEGADIDDLAAYIPSGRTTPIDFDNVDVDVDPTTRRFTVVNHGVTAFNLIVASLPPGFHVHSDVADDVPVRIEPGETYELRLQVDPTMTGTSHGYVVLAAINGAAEVRYSFVVRHLLHPSVNQASLVPGLEFELVSGDLWHSIPSFELLSRTTGIVDNFLLNEDFGSDRFAVRYTGYLHIAEAGLYTFAVNSDDGSKLWIGDMLIVSNDFRHAPRSRSATLGLEEGYHPIRVEFFEADGGQVLEVSYGRHEGSIVELTSIPKEVLFRPSGAAGDESPPNVTFPGLSINVDEPTPINPETWVLMATAQDNESGVSPYEYRYHWNRYNGVGWEDVVDSPSNAGGMTLGPLVENALYRIALSAVNGAGQVGSSGFRYFLVDTTPPELLDVLVAGSQWTEPFYSYLASQGFGTDGYSLVTAVRPLPWRNISQVKLVVNELLGTASVPSLFGTSVPGYELVTAGVSAGTAPGTFVYTWELAVSISADDLLLALAGTWHDQAGNQLEGTIALLFDVLPGDIDGNRGVNFPDFLQTRARVGQVTGGPTYDVHYDVDGNGGINFADALFVRSQIGTNLQDAATTQPMPHDSSPSSDISVVTPTAALEPTPTPQDSSPNRQAREARVFVLPSVAQITLAHRPTSLRSFLLAPPRVDLAIGAWPTLSVRSQPPISLIHATGPRSTDSPSPSMDPGPARHAPRVDSRDSTPDSPDSDSLGLLLDLGGAQLSDERHRHNRRKS